MHFGEFVKIPDLDGFRQNHLDAMRSLVHGAFAAKLLNSFEELSIFAASLNLEELTIGAALLFQVAIVRDAAVFHDHHFVAAVSALPTAMRFTTPAKKILAPVLEVLGSDDPLLRKKRGFNPPIEGWLRDDLSLRLVGLGERLQNTTSGQFSSHSIDALIASWTSGEHRLAEQVLQLIILDESLAQSR